MTTSFGFSSTTDDVLAGVDLTGRRVVVTGGSSGIGVETARALAAAGAEVVLAVRRDGPETAALITEQTGNPLVGSRPLDLAVPSSVAAFVRDWTGPLHVLVNNAGIMAVPELRLTAEGHEVQFATNFLGHFALTTGLRAALAEAGGARVVSLSSNAHHFSDVVLDDLAFQHRAYDPWLAYGQSKTADVLLAVGVTRHWADDGILANAVNPGAIATGLQKHTGGLRTPVEKRKTIPQGAATSVLLAASPLVEGIGGRYFEDCAEAPVLAGSSELFGGGVAAWAVDADNADRLWDTATRLIR
ncbi:SDR family NAD(P)-dependent oxidoreductase [Umezawaea sp. Da 62-37]|uniref:SDR family NAD(P)-dependent oxidoreductase n=1 Tax=Umezawaea sp. Da 62-37 TaxID=3075927 RepID=UPI0028F71602|nr:SDR family NAD(P)-dependent oxidoreductase [Umezawaea sp. Da 62-37]WNV91389.1 SDR family NAD(P)-dependent oxidoreductase [Umezawaea sp. Da 62-37]